MTATFLLIRHAAHVDLDQRLSGRRGDVPLSADGRAQAARLGERLHGKAIDQLVASPLTRAQTTARAIADQRGCAIETVEGLTELEFGDWTGRSFTALHDDPAWTEWNRTRSTARPPSGESMAEGQARIVGWMRQMAEDAAAETIAAVTHSDLIKAAVCHVLGLSLDNLHAFDIDPASITRIVLGGWGGRVLGLNGKGD